MEKVCCFLTSETAMQCDVKFNSLRAICDLFVGTVTKCLGCKGEFKQVSLMIII